VQRRRPRAVSGPLLEGTLFARTPPSPVKNPNDFFCTWSIATKNTGDKATFATDNDAGLCPNTGTTSSLTVGTWSPHTSNVPEPASAVLLESGLLGLVGWGFGGFEAATGNGQSSSFVDRHGSGRSASNPDLPFPRPRTESLTPSRRTHSSSASADKFIDLASSQKALK
jgi:hypothetical protein